jgi:hypothetical protein
MIGAPWSVDLQTKRLDHRRPESNIGFEATPEFLGRRVIEQIAQALRTALAEPAYQQKLIDSGFEASPERSRRSDRPDGRLIGQAGEAAFRHR